MAQTLRPVATVDASDWAASSGTLDSATADASDATYAESANNPSSGNVAVVQIDDAGNPGSGDHSLFYRFAKSASNGRQIDLTVYLSHGDTLIDSWTHENIGDTVTEQERAFTPPGGIDWADIRVGMEGNTVGVGAGRRARIHDTWIVVPDSVAPPVEVEAEHAVATVTPLAATLTLGAFEGAAELGVLTVVAMDATVERAVATILGEHAVLTVVVLDAATVQGAVEVSAEFAVATVVPQDAVVAIPAGLVIEAGFALIHVDIRGVRLVGPPTDWIEGSEDMTTRKSNAFAPPPFDALADPSRYVILRDEFAGGAAYAQSSPVAIGDLGWTVNENIEESTAAIQATAGRIGVLRLTAGVDATPAAGDNTVWSLNAAGFKLGDEPVYLAFEVALPSVADVELHVGVASAAEDDRGANAVLVEFDKSAEDDLQFVTVDDTSNVTALATAIEPAADGWLLIEMTLTSEEVQARINGGSVFQITEDIPADTIVLFPVIKLETETTAIKSVDVDSFVLRMAQDRGF